MLNKVKEFDIILYKQILILVIFVLVDQSEKRSFSNLRISVHFNVEANHELFILILSFFQAIKFDIYIYLAFLTVLHSELGNWLNS